MMRSGVEIVGGLGRQDWMICVWRCQKYPPAFSIWVDWTGAAQHGPGILHCMSKCCFSTPLVYALLLHMYSRMAVLQEIGDSCSCVVRQTFASFPRLSASPFRERN
jgi:hypothetical protein